MSGDFDMDSKSHASYDEHACIKFNNLVDLLEGLISINGPLEELDDYIRALENAGVTFSEKKYFAGGYYKGNVTRLLRVQGDLGDEVWQKIVKAAMGTEWSVHQAVWGVRNPNKDNGVVLQSHQRKAQRGEKGNSAFTAIAETVSEVLGVGLGTVPVVQQAANWYVIQAPQGAELRLDELAAALDRRGCALLDADGQYHRTHESKEEFTRRWKEAAQKAGVTGLSGDLAELDLQATLAAEFPEASWGDLRVTPVYNLYGKRKHGWRVEGISDEIRTQLAGKAQGVKSAMGNLLRFGVLGALGGGSTGWAQVRSDMGVEAELPNRARTGIPVAAGPQTAADVLVGLAGVVHTDGTVHDAAQRLGPGDDGTSALETVLQALRPDVEQKTTDPDAVMELMRNRAHTSEGLATMKAVVYDLTARDEWISEIEALRVMDMSPPPSPKGGKGRESARYSPYGSKPRPSQH